MKTNPNLKHGDFVISLAGRDRGRIFIVCDVIDENYVTVIDGKLRKLEKPKKKKLRHVKRWDVPPMEGVPEINRQLAAAIKNVKAFYHNKIQ